MAQVSAKPDIDVLPLSGAAAAAAVAPTRVRFGVMAFLCSMALLLYVDRVCIGQAADSIRADLGLTKTQMGWAFTVFSLAYALFEVPAGHWGDRHGSRGVIARVVIWWSLFTALTGAAVGLWSLLLIRFLFGAGEAGAFPNAARVVTRWFPEHERGRVRGGDHVRLAGRGDRRAAAVGLHDPLRRLAVDVRDLRRGRRGVGGGVLPVVPRRPGPTPSHERRRARPHRRRRRPAPTPARTAASRGPPPSPAPTSGCSGRS